MLPHGPLCVVVVVPRDTASMHYFFSLFPLLAARQCSCCLLCSVAPSLSPWPVAKEQHDPHLFFGCLSCTVTWFPSGCFGFLLAVLWGFWLGMTGYTADIMNVPAHTHTHQSRVGRLSTTNHPARPTLTRDCSPEIMVRAVHPGRPDTACVRLPAYRFNGPGGWWAVA